MPQSILPRPSRPSAPPRPKPAADKEHQAALKAGIFLLSAVGMAVLVLVVLGSAHRLFARNASYTVYFPDVDGLKLDSPVRLGGLTVGRVSEISFSNQLNDTRVRVKIEVAQD